MLISLENFTARSVWTFNSIKSRLLGFIIFTIFITWPNFLARFFVGGGERERVGKIPLRVNHFSRCIACHQCLKNASYTIPDTVCFLPATIFHILFFFAVPLPQVLFITLLNISLSFALMMKARSFRFFPSGTLLGNII